jgi:cathepsin D
MGNSFLSAGKCELTLPNSILGLAFPAISNLNQNPFFNTAAEEGAVKSSEFGFYLASSGSELFLGGTNSEHYSGDLEYHDVDTSTGFWQITGAKATVAGSSAVTGFETIIDSGTTIMYGPPASVKKVWAKVKGSKLFDSENGYYSFPCNSDPEIAFSWGGKSFSISSAK